MAKRQRRWFKWLFGITLLGFAAWCVGMIALVGTIHHRGTVDEAQTADVIVVLGAGLSRSGRPGYALTRRASHAAELWHAGYAETIICTGGLAENRNRTEADACREVLSWRDVPASAVVLEGRSRSTEENALYTAEIMSANAWETAIVVSDSYHVLRADYLFTSEGIEVFTSPVPAEQIRGRPTYTYSVLREVAAFHWQIFKDIFGIPVTNIS